MPSNNNNTEVNLNTQTLDTITNLVLAGGGSKGALYPGALKALEHIGILGHIETVAGSSAGALTSAMLAIGLTPDEIDEQFKTKSFADFLKTTKLTNGGLFSTGSLKRHVNEVLYTHLARKLQNLYQKHKGHLKRDDREFIWQLLSQLVTANRSQCVHPTFNDLARLASIFNGLDEDNPHPFKKLIVTMTEYEPGNKEGKTVYCKAEDPEFGNKSIAEVVACSACLPIVFAPIKIGNKIYRDGGIYDNTPIDGIPATEHQQTLALVFEDSSMSHEQAIFSKNEPKMAEAKLSDKAIEAGFDASLPKCVFNDAVTVRQHAARIIRLMVPNGLGVATMKLTPELAIQATVNGYISVMTWAKAFYPSHVSETATEESAHPIEPVDGPKSTSTLSRALYARLEKQTGFMAEKARLVEEQACLHQKRFKLESTKAYMESRDIPLHGFDKRIEPMSEELETYESDIRKIDEKLVSTSEKLLTLSKKLLETKIYARHFLTSKILAWKESIKSARPIFKHTLNNFVEEVYLASKNIDDGKFFADNVDKISNLITLILNNDVDKDKLTIEFSEISNVFFNNPKKILMEQFNFSLSMLLSSIHDYSLLSQLKARAAQMPTEDLQARANDLLTTLERAMEDVYQQTFDSIEHRKLQNILNSVNNLFNTIDQEIQDTIRVKPSTPPLRRTKSYADVSTLTQGSDTVPTKAASIKLNTHMSYAPTNIANDIHVLRISKIQTKTGELHLRIAELATTTAEANIESQAKQNKLSQAFSRFSKAVSRFFSATFAAVRPSSFGIWRRQSTEPTAERPQAEERPAAAA